jgi:hypothetical protein
MFRLQAQVRESDSESTISAENPALNDAEGGQTKRAASAEIRAWGRLPLETEITKLVQKTYIHDRRKRDSLSGEAALKSKRNLKISPDAPLTELGELLHADGALSDQEFEALKMTPVSEPVNPLESYTSGRSGRRDRTPLQAAWRIIKSPFGTQR